MLWYRKKTVEDKGNICIERWQDFLTKRYHGIKGVLRRCAIQTDIFTTVKHCYHVYAAAKCLSVCLSVCLSQVGVLPKRLSISPQFYLPHQHLAPLLGVISSEFRRHLLAFCVIKLEFLGYRMPLFAWYDKLKPVFHGLSGSNSCCKSQQPK